jgi:hypothetical protein
MKISQYYQSGKTTLAFEIFPPKPEVRWRICSILLRDLKPFHLIT